MDLPQLVEKYSPFIQKNLLPIVLGAVGLIFLGYGLIAFLGGSRGGDDILFEGANDSTENSEKSHSLIAIDIQGAIIKPGVYTLPSESRIQDAFIAAGGLSAETDRDWVAKNINLAAKLTDGAKIYVPKSGEDITPLRSAQPGFVGQAGIAGTININTANESELDSLPGVGPATIEKIISGRPYSSIEELLEKKIVGQKVFDNIKEKISIY